jgi:hypothetical protein
MQPKRILEHLEGLAEKLGIEIVYEKLGGEDLRVTGGLCRVRGTFKIFVDRSETVEGRIEVVARALASFDTEQFYLVPQIREILDKAQGGV